MSLTEAVTGRSSRYAKRRGGAMIPLGRVGELNVTSTIIKRITLTLAVIAVVAGASACDFRNPDGQQQVRGPGVFPTPAVLTSTS
jgi:hypothetical protein